jgi:hypothetical protein
MWHRQFEPEIYINLSQTNYVWFYYPFYPVSETNTPILDLSSTKQNMANWNVSYNMVTKRATQIEFTENQNMGYLLIILSYIIHYILLYIYIIFYDVHHILPVVPHKAVAEVSKIGNL